MSGSSPASAGILPFTLWQSDPKEKEVLTDARTQIKTVASSEARSQLALTCRHMRAHADCEEVSMDPGKLSFSHH